MSNQNDSEYNPDLFLLDYPFFIFQILTIGRSWMWICAGVVIRTDLKSVGLCPRRFESCQIRFCFGPFAIDLTT